MTQQTTIEAGSMIVNQVIKGGVDAMVNMNTTVGVLSTLADLGGTFVLLFTLYIGLVAVREDLTWKNSSDFIVRMLGICIFGTIVAFAVQNSVSGYVGSNLKFLVGIIVVFAMTTNDIRWTIMNILKPLGNFILALVGRKPLSDDDLNYKGASHKHEHEPNEDRKPKGVHDERCKD